MLSIFGKIIYSAKAVTEPVIIDAKHSTGRYANTELSVSIKAISIWPRL